MGRFINGGTDKIVAASTVALPSGHVTVSVWVQWLAVNSANQSIVSELDGSATNGFFLWFPQAGGFTKARYSVRNGGVLADYTGTNTTGNTTTPFWAHMAMTWDGTTLTGYFNGAVDGTPGSGSGSVSTSSTSCNIGFDPSGNAAIPSAYIADVGIWNAVLSAGNITSLANGVRPGSINAANLNAWWPLDGYASPEPDISGNSNNGTLTGTTRILGPPALWRVSG